MRPPSRRSPPAGPGARLCRWLRSDPAPRCRPLRLEVRSARSGPAPYCRPRCRPSVPPVPEPPGHPGVLEVRPDPRGRCRPFPRPPIPHPGDPGLPIVGGVLGDGVDGDAASLSSIAMPSTRPAPIACRLAVRRDLEGRDVEGDAVVDALGGDLDAVAADEAGGDVGNRNADRLRRAGTLGRDVEAARLLGERGRARVVGIDVGGRRHVQRARLLGELLGERVLGIQRHVRPRCTPEGAGRRSARSASR